MGVQLKRGLPPRRASRAGQPQERAPQGEPGGPNTPETDHFLRARTNARPRWVKINLRCACLDADHRRLAVVRSAAAALAAALEHANDQPPPQLAPYRSLIAARQLMRVCRECLTKRAPRSARADFYAHSAWPPIRRAKTSTPTYPFRPGKQARSSLFSPMIPTMAPLRRLAPLPCPADCAGREIQSYCPSDGAHRRRARSHRAACPLASRRPATSSTRRRSSTFVAQGNPVVTDLTAHLPENANHAATMPLRLFWAARLGH